MTGMIGLDFETYSAVDLFKHGMHRYMQDKTFQPLIASLCVTNGIGGLDRARLEVWESKSTAARQLRDTIGDAQIVAQNAGFEDSVLSWFGLTYPASRFVDSAVIARAAGAGGHLEACAPQLLDVDKLASGKNLIKLFSVPGKYQEKHGSPNFSPDVILENPDEWEEFKVYCDLDAELGLRIAETNLGRMTGDEMYYQSLTMHMNREGWPVDLDLVYEMQRRYQANMDRALRDFTTTYPDSDINLNSLKQMKEWCARRGIKATSFDEKHVASLAKRIEDKLANQIGLAPDKASGYAQVLHLLQTKQILGGSSLKKLQVIIDTAVETDKGWRLKDQYVHCGAGQTLRTSGRSVQMQNLKQLGQPADVEDLFVPDEDWSNSQLAENMRQCFTSSDPGGHLIVGDFKSVESRGLAYLAGEAWKLNAYRKGEDLYQLLADKFGNTRKFGKVGELSCGYGAGGGAVQAFASKMGVEMTEGEASGLVYDWRDACPRTLDLWAQLDAMLRRVVVSSVTEKYVLDSGLVIKFQITTTPATLRRLNPRAQSVEMSLVDHTGNTRLKRYFHGCYQRGRNIAYYKPSDRKTGDLWSATFVDPKTKQRRYYELYGGKLAGILTQSFCREIFMYILSRVHVWSVANMSQARVVGQFHDEIVVDWVPGSKSLEVAKMDLDLIMRTGPVWLPQFPLESDIKSAYRYIK